MTRSKNPLIQKAFMHGCEALSDAELAAVYLGVTLEDGAALVSEGLACLVDSASRVRITPQKRLNLRAAAELARRTKLSAEQAPTLASAPAVDAFIRPQIVGLMREKVWTICVNGRSRVMACRIVSVGSLMSSVIHPREVFRPAIEVAAAAVILVHNHPSGDPTPSVEDHQVTARLAEAGTVIGIRLLDHVVVAAGGFRSFKDEGWLAQ